MWTQSVGLVMQVQMASPNTLTMQYTDLFSHLTAQLPVGYNITLYQ